MSLIAKTVAATLTIALIAGGAGGFLFMASGVYPIAADRPHFSPVQWLLATGRTRSVEFHSRNIEPKHADDVESLTRGFTLYVIHCQICHGGPGVPPGQAGRGINPTPPPMVSAAHEWTDPQLYWILTRGLKMSGMPAFGVRLTESDRWALVGFLRRLPLIQPSEYQRLAASLGPDGSAAPVGMDFRAGGDHGFAGLDANGRAERGRSLFRSLGCSSCHIAKDLGASMVGPDLRGFAEREYVAGRLPNVPSALADWIQRPQEFKPDTAMPNLGVGPQEATDLVAYLYSSGATRRLEMLRETLTRRR